MCHKCDTPACVNPDHLFEGTQLENLADRERKGRTVRGEQHPATKFTDAQVAQIRAEVAGGASQTAVRLAYGISRSHVSWLCSNKGRIVCDPPAKYTAQKPALKSTEYAEFSLRAFASPSRRLDSIE
jgi:hypothetical protein